MNVKFTQYDWEWTLILSNQWFLCLHMLEILLKDATVEQMDLKNKISINGS